MVGEDADGVLRRLMERNEHVALDAALIDAHVARAGVPGGGVGEHFKVERSGWTGTGIIGSNQ